MSNKTLYICYILLQSILISLCYYIEEKHHDKIINNFAFGSCFYGRLSTRLDMFKTIQEHNPELWVWLGDAAYADLFFPLNKKIFDYEFSQDMFNKSKNNEYYKPFNQKTPSIAVWDDHDYSINDGNGLFKHKIEAKKLFLDYIDEPENSPRRSPDRGIYATYSFGDKNSHKNFRIILLDVRYNKTSYWYNENPDILGEDQWVWFEDVLKNSDETFIFIGSGTQVLPFDRFFTEAWYQYSRQRFFDLIAKYKKSGVVIISGDIHSAEILRTPCVLPDIGYPLYEITSSGLSHFYRLAIIFDHVWPNRYSFLPNIDYYNFAKIDFDWGNSKEESKLTVNIIDIDDIRRYGLTLKYSDLKHNSNFKNNTECYRKLNSRLKDFNEYIEYYKKNKVYIIVPIIYIGLFLGLFSFLFLVIYLFYRVSKFVLKSFFRVLGLVIGFFMNLILGKQKSN